MDLGDIFSAENEEEVLHTLYIQTVLDGAHATDDAINIAESVVLKQAAEAVNLEVDQSVVNVLETGECLAEYTLTGCIKPSEVEVVVETVSEILVNNGIDMKGVLPHECPLPPLVDKDNFTLDSIDMSRLQPEDAVATFDALGFGVFRNCMGDESILKSVASNVTSHVAKTMEVVAELKEIDENERIKFKEIMQRDSGRFDISLQEAAGMKDFVEFVSPERSSAVESMAENSSTESARAPWLGAIDGILGQSQYSLCRTGVVVSTGGEKTKSQFWHADGNESLDPKQAVCFFIPLCDLDDRTGYTSFWPGSHQFKQSLLLEHHLPDVMPKGSMVKGDVNFGDGLIYDYKLIHRGEANHMDSGEMRPILYIVYAVDDFVEPNFSSKSIYDAISCS